jgi:hypothetical protein
MVEKERAQQNVAFCGARIELVVFYFFGWFFFSCGVRGVLCFGGRKET